MVTRRKTNRNINQDINFLNSTNKSLGRVRVKNNKIYSLNRITPINPFYKTNSNKQVSYLGLKQAKNINYGGLKGPYGDKDFDGSPNKWDCSPNNPGKDGILADITRAVFNRKPKSKATIRKEKSQYVQNFEQQGKVPLMTKLAHPLTYNQKAREYVNKIRQDQMVGEKLTAQREVKDARMQQLLEQVPKGLSDRARSEYVQQEYARQYPPQNNNQKQIIQKVIVKKGKREESPNTKNKRRVFKAVAALTPEGTVPLNYTTHPDDYRRLLRSQNKKLSQLNKNLKGTNYRGQPRKSGPKGGRPYGSYTHEIPGKGFVSVYEWRKWDREQKRIERIRNAQVSQQQVPQETQGSNQQYQQQSQPTQQYQQTQQYPNGYQQQFNESDALNETQLPQDNKFVVARNRMRDILAYQQNRRMAAEQPAGHVQSMVAMRKQALDEERAFNRRTNILNSHKQMLTEQQNDLGFMNMDSENNILMAENLFSSQNPNNQNVFQPTGRPSILQAQGMNDSSEMNPLAARPLNFGKVNLTQDESY